MHSLSSVYFVSHPSACFGRTRTPSSGGKSCGYNSWYLLFVLYDYKDNRRSSKTKNKYQSLYLHGVPPDDGL